AGQQITFGYDNRDRLRSRASPTETATFLYDLASRMTHAQNSADTEDFGYDLRDDLITETTNIPGLPTQIVQHQYDLAGNRTRLPYPDGASIDTLTGPLRLREEWSDVRLFVRKSHCPLQRRRAQIEIKPQIREVERMGRRFDLKGWVAVGFRDNEHTGE